MLEYIDIRLATVEDCKAVEGCVTNAYTGYIERIGKPPAPMLADYAALIAQGVVYILMTQAQLVGVLVMKPLPTCLLVENVAVQPACQGRGFGRKLMDFAEQFARNIGLDEVHLYTNERMTENLDFYASLGFQELSRREEDGYRRVFLGKKL